MYILMEKARAEEDDNVRNWDCMGMVETEEEAMAWRNANLEYRLYKWCSLPKDK